MVRISDDTWYDTDGTTCQGSVNRGEDHCSALGDFNVSHKNKAIILCGKHVAIWMNMSSREEIEESKVMPINAVPSDSSVWGKRYYQLAERFGQIKPKAFIMMGEAFRRLEGELDGKSEGDEIALEALEAAIKGKEIYWDGFYSYPDYKRHVLVPLELE